MSAVPAKAGAEFLSPLAAQLGQFLAQKHAMGYRYREEGRALRQLDSFLTTRLSPEDPLITLAIVQDYVARRGTETETTRAHRLTLIRELCRFLQLEDARTVVPDRRTLRITRQGFVARTQQRRGEDLSAGMRQARGWTESRPLAMQCWARPCEFSFWLDCELENCCGSLRLM
jgi:hypothetical protein